MNPISTIYVTSINFLKIIMLIFDKTLSKNTVHSAKFWKRKALQLSMENKELLQQIQELKASREIADKVFLESKRKLDDLEYNLEIYNEEIEDKKKSLIDRERLLCDCARDEDYPVLYSHYSDDEGSADGSIPIGIAFLIRLSNHWL
jgi:peptidoglycan hydrolase CwlO-like protein